MEAGSYVMWISPEHRETFSNSPAAQVIQQEHIRKHGYGPFKVTKVIPISGGKVVEFKDQNNNVTRVNVTWLFNPPPYCPRIFAN